MGFFVICCLLYCDACGVALRLGFSMIYGFCVFGFFVVCRGFASDFRFCQFLDLRFWGVSGFRGFVGLLLRGLTSVTWFCGFVL